MNAGKRLQTRQCFKSTIAEGVGLATIEDLQQPVSSVGGVRFSAVTTCTYVPQLLNPGGIALSYRIHVPDTLRFTWWPQRCVCTLLITARGCQSAHVTSRSLVAPAHEASFCLKKERWPVIDGMDRDIDTQTQIGKEQRRKRAWKLSVTKVRRCPPAAPLKGHPPPPGWHPVTLARGPSPK